MAITVKHKFVSAIPDAGDPTIVQPSNWNDTHDLVGTVPVANGGTGAATLTGYVKGSGTANMTAAATIPSTDVTGLGTMAAQNANSVAITGGTMSGVAVTGYIPTSEKAQPLGVATLDAGGKVPTSQIPMQGDLNYQGTWNASTNSPTLVSSVGTKGYYYVVDVAGSTNLNGITDWQIGDWCIFNGTVWQKVDNTDTVTSVNGKVGTVVLTTTDIAEGTNLYYTDVRARASNSAGTGISYNSTTGVITNSSPSLGGDVVGPASATNNAIPRFDTTTGKLLKNSVVTIGDTGVIAGATSVTDINFVDFNTAYATALTEGQLGWNGNNTLALGMAGGNVVQHIGEDSYFYIKASAAITKGQLIMYTGAVGASGVITGAPATGITSGQNIIGIAAETMALNAFGLVQWFGELIGLNTSAFTEGDIVYYNSAVTGGLTNVYPTTGLIITVGSVAKTSAGGGVLVVRVSVTQRITASTGISVSQTSTGSVITNTAPDQTVAITAGTGISVTGTYPNFSVTNTAPSSGGTVTSVSATAPIASTGGNTPTISIATANTTTTGALTSTDWNTFNGKQAALISGTNIKTVNGTSLLGSGDVPVGVLTITGTAPVVSSGGANPAISMAAATGSVNGYLTSTDWTTFNNKSNTNGTVTSVAALTIGTTGTDLSSTVATGTTTPVISLQVPTASATNRGALSAADWTTFNGKAPAVTYTTSYVPYGQGTTTLNQNANFNFNGTVLNAPIQRASNGIVVNSKTVSASYTIATGDSAMSAGPITVSSGIVVTVSSGSRWVVL